MRLLPGLRPGPRWGAYSAPQTPQLGKIVHPERSVTYFVFLNDMPAVVELVFIEFMIPRGLAVDTSVCPVILKIYNFFCPVQFFS